MIHIVAPILVTVEKARFRMPANIAVICIIRNTAKVIPINSAGELAFVIHEQLESDPEDATVLHYASPLPAGHCLYDRKLFIALVLMGGLVGCGAIGTL